MRAIVIVMLIVQAAIVLVAIWTMLTAKSDAARRPVWSGLIVSLVIIAGVSWNIGERHAGQPGAEILMYVSPLLLGMAIMGALFALRKKRGLD